jgi:hypothetical protein
MNSGVLFVPNGILVLCQLVWSSPVKKTVDPESGTGKYKQENIDLLRHAANGEQIVLSGMPKSKRASTTASKSRINPHENMNKRATA